MLNKIRRVGRETGNGKVKMLKTLPELKPVLLAAYNPFLKYYLSAPDINGMGDGKLNRLCDANGTISKEGFCLLEDLNTRQLGGQAAFEAVCDFIVNLHPKCAILFKMILNKDLRIGLGTKTINKAFPGLIPTSLLGDKPELMLCKTFRPEKAVYPLIAAVKKDGIRGRVSHQGTSIQTRSGRLLGGMTHLENELDEYDFEKDGEVIVPGNDFDSGSGLMRNDSLVPDAEFWIFDVPSIPGSKAVRLAYMREHIHESSHIKIVEHRTCQNEEELMAFYREAVDAGEEGLVVYTPEHLYRDARSMDWCRLCPRKKAECVVIRFEEGKGKFEGSLGKLVVSFPDEKGKVHTVKVGTGLAEKPWEDLTEKAQNKLIESGMDEEAYEDTRRGYIWENQEKFLGALAQLEYKERTKAGSMRQPAFKGWRWDKEEANMD